MHGHLDVQSNAALFTFVGRLDQQKGFDILAEAVRSLLDEDKKEKKHDIQLLGLGSGDPAIEKLFTALAHEFSGKVCVIAGYSDECAAKIYAAGDFFVIPSRFEPCGLTDFFAQLLGNVPIVHGIGGLVKTLDGRFGYSYIGGSVELESAIRRALSDHRESGRQKIRTMQRAAVENIYENFTWEKVLEKKYFPLYQLAADRMKPSLPY